MVVCYCAKGRDMFKRPFVVVLVVAIVVIVGLSVTGARKASAYGGDPSYGQFTSDKCLMYGDLGTGGVDIAARDNNVYVVAAPHVPGMNGIWFIRSQDYGAHWGPWIRVYEPNGYYNIEDPTITLGGASNVLYVACDGQYTTASVGSDVSVFRSDNCGDSWGLYHRIAAYQQDSFSLYSFIDPSLSSNANRVMLTYTRRSYDPTHSVYYATIICGFQIEPNDTYFGKPGVVSSGIWNYSSRCAVAMDGSYWFTWKSGNVWDGDVYAVHYSSTGNEVPSSRVFLSGSASHPDIGISASGVVNVVYNRWDGYNHWACVRGTADAYNWWAEQLLKAASAAGGGGNNHCPRACNNSTDSSGDLLLGWAVYRTAWNGDFSGSTFRWGGEPCHDLGTLMNLANASGYNNNIEQYQTFDICTNGTYHYLVAENWNGSIWVKRNDFTPPQCDGVTTSSGSGSKYGGTLYTNSDFAATFNSVRDDWDTTSLEWYDVQPPMGMGADGYVRGVTRLEATLNGGHLIYLDDDPDHDGNWGVSVGVGGRADGNYVVGGSFWDTAGNGVTLPSSNNVVVDRVPPTGAISFSGYSGGGVAEAYTNKDFNVSFDAADNSDITGQEDGGSDQFTKGVTLIDMKYATSPDANPIDWKSLPTKSGSHTIDNAPWVDVAKLGADPLLADGSWYVKGVVTDVAGNVCETTPKKITVDTLNPEVNLDSSAAPNSQGWVNKDATISFSVSDSNPDKVEYKVDKAGAGKGSWGSYTGPFKLEDGEYTITYRATDKAGNVSGTHTENYKVDTQAPSCAVTEPAKDFIQTGFTKDQKAKISGFAEDSGSGIASERLYMGSSKIADGNGGDISCNWDVSNINQGIYEIKVESSDNAGNNGTAIKRVNVANYCKDWYFAEGNTLPEFDEWLCIANPGEENANVQLSFMLESGEVINKLVVAGAKTRTTFDVKNFVPEGHEGVSTHVHCDTQAVIAERAMYFNYKAADPTHNWKGGHSALGLNTLQKEFYFAEGTTRANVTDGQFEEWLTLLNPGERTASIDITYMLGDGRNIYKQQEVDPHSRVTVDVPADVGKDQDVSTKVVSNEPIAAERPMYFDYHGYAKEGHNVVGTSSPGTDWLFAEGNTLSTFQTWITIQNPNDTEAHLTFRYLTDQGKVVDVKRSVGPRSRWTENVLSDVGDGQNFSTEINADIPVVCERPMYFDYKDKWTGGHDAMGETSLSTRSYIAEGTTRSDFETWYTIGNPSGSDANVKITYLIAGGGNKVANYKVSAHARLTIDVNDQVGPGKDVSSYIESDKPVMIERPMYFNYEGTRDGGSDSPAYGVD